MIDILIIDDFKANTMILESMIHRLKPHLKVKSVQSFDDFSFELTTNKPQKCIIFDVMLDNDQNGLLLLEYIKDELKDIEIILYTGMEANFIKGQMECLNIKKILEKPISMDKVKEVISHL